MIARRLTILAGGLLLSGCSAALLENVADLGELAPPRSCHEPTKLFGTFTMRAARSVWKGDRNDRNPTLTLELTFDNDRNFPVALSNSGTGVLYTMQFTLVGQKGDLHLPAEAAGITLIRKPRKFVEPPKPGAFGYATPPRIKDRPADYTRDVNYRIKPGQSEAGTLTFAVPRGNYLLSVERQFSGRRASGQLADHIAVCKVSGDDAGPAKPVEIPANPGTN